MIVVGLDGSNGPRRALHWALAEASLRGCAVEVTTAWPSRDLVTKMELLDAAEAQQSAIATQQRVIDEELEVLSHPPKVSYEVVHGDPVKVLLSASSSAALLVVGSHNTSRITHVMLGSVKRGMRQNGRVSRRCPPDGKTCSTSSRGCHHDGCR